jgi:hypothetical protein
MEENGLVLFHCNFPLSMDVMQYTTTCVPKFSTSGPCVNMETLEFVCVVIPFEVKPNPQNLQGIRQRIHL